MLRKMKSKKKQTAGAVISILLLVILIASAAKADALTMKRMDGSGFTVYFAHNPEGEKEKSEVLHVLGSQTAYCMNSRKPFQKGNAVAIDKSDAGWDTAHERKAALAWYYVREVSGVSLTKLQQEQIIQVIIWNIFKDKVTEHVWTLDPPKETFVSITEAFESWYNANKDRYSYTASFYANEDDPVTSQAVAVFSVTELTGKIHMKKTSADSSVSGGNACYSLSGAVYQVYTDSACTKKAVTTGGANASVTTDAAGKSGSVELAPGTYYVKETKAPAGFGVNSGVSKVTVSGSAAEQEISVQDAPVFDAGGLVIRKIDAETGQSAPASGRDLAGAEYTVRFYAGIYTKDNLPSSPAKTWVIRSVKTSSGGKTVYEASLSDACRVSGDAFFKSGGKVILPLGTITVQETKEPKGYFRSDSWKDGAGKAVSGLYVKNIKASSGASGAALDGGNVITNLEQPFPEIGTTLAEENGSRYLPAAEGAVTLIDTVEIRHFNQYTGQKVTFTGTLKDQDGKTAAQGKTTVTVTAQMSSVKVPITFDPAAYQGKMLYCDEKAEDSGGKLIASHEGRNDDRQKVFVPEIATSLVDEGTGSGTVSFKEEESGSEGSDGGEETGTESGGGDGGEGTGTESGDADGGEGTGTESGGTNRGIVSLKDTITYRNLEPGTQRIMNAALYDAETGEPVKDADGEPVTASQQFTVAAGGSGTAEVMFSFRMAEETEGCDLVAFENCEDLNGRKYAVHADLTDRAQTVYAVRIGTAVRNRKNGLRIALAEEDTALADRVFVSNLDPDKEYRLEARAVLKSTAEEPEVPVRAWAVFRTEGGRITILRQSADESREESDGDSGEGDGSGQSDDNGQSGNENAEENSGESGNENSEENSGEESDGENPDEDSRKEPAEIRAESELQENGRVSGYVDVEIPAFDAAVLNGESLVFFETLYEMREEEQGEKVASHGDPEDEEQTLHFPDGHTVLLDDGTGEHHSPEEEVLRWTDTYSYRNLIPGVRYTLKASVRDKKTGEYLHLIANDEPDTDEEPEPGEEPDTDDEPDTAEEPEETDTCAVLSFEPEEPDGEVTVPFRIKGEEAAGKTWVAEETLLCGGTTVHIHSDPEDEAQSIYVPKIRTIASDTANGSHDGVLSNHMILRDEVFCTGLQAGSSYLITGTAMIREENGSVLPVTDSEGEALTGSASFVSDPSGEEETVTVEFPPFDAEQYDGKTVVIFERLYYVKETDGEQVLTAVHEDPENEDQFVRIPVRPPVPEKPEQSKKQGTPEKPKPVITPEPEAVTPAPVRKQGAKDVKTGDDTKTGVYLILFAGAIVLAAILLLVKVRVYLFKKRR
ncbi:MAG: hypothetical protein E7240_09735 [Lachnospiraceae bacterium]|nr:hypothetical protein [Lachnospiraceae bacterium]